jgi:DNA-binding FadR family transcriptional regulator
MSCFSTPLVSEDEAKEIFETRGVIEPYLIRQTAAKATKEDMERLKILVKEMNEAFHGGNPMAVGRSSRQDSRRDVANFRPPHHDAASGYAEYEADPLLVPLGNGSRPRPQHQE